MGINFHGSGFGNNFLVVTSKVQAMKEKVDKLDFIKIKKFCSSKLTIKKCEKTTHNREESIYILYI